MEINSKIAQKCLKFVIVEGNKNIFNWIQIFQWEKCVKFMGTLQEMPRNDKKILKSAKNFEIQKDFLQMKIMKI